ELLAALLELEAEDGHRRDDDGAPRRGHAGGDGQLADPLQPGSADEPGRALVAVVGTLGAGVEDERGRRGGRHVAPAVEGPQRVLEGAVQAAGVGRGRSDGGDGGRGRGGGRVHRRGGGGGGPLRGRLGD